MMPGTAAAYRPPPAGVPGRAAGRIVLGVAGGTPPEVVDAAFGLAAERGAPLLAVRVWHDPELPLGGWLTPARTTRWDAAHRNARRGLDRALAGARAAHPAVEVTTLVVDDEVVPFLAALGLRAQLLVLGRCRRLGHRDSPVDALVRHAVCPVLVVPPLRRPSRSPAAAPAAAGG